MKHLFAAHLIPTHWGRSDEEHLRRIAPRSIKIIDRFSRVPRLRELSPNSLIVYRDHPLSEQHDDMWRDPAGTGRRHADDWGAKLARWKHGVPPERAVVLGINEPHVWRDPDPKRANSADAEGVRRTVEYTVAFLDRLTELGIRGGALNLSVGWPANRGVDEPPDWTPYEPVRDAMARGKHFLFLHEYWDHNGPGNRWGWWAGRALRCPWNVPIIIGECGMEERVAKIGLPPSRWGWQGWLTESEYMRQLWEYHDLMAVDPRIHSLQIFTWDFSPPFESTDIRRILHLIPANDSWDDMADWDYGQQPPAKPQPQPQPQPPVSELARILREEADRRQAVHFNPQAALQRAMAADGYAPNSPEFSLEYSGVVYVAQRGENLTSGDVRVYYVEQGDWGNVRWV